MSRILFYSTRKRKKLKKKIRIFKIFFRNVFLKLFLKSPISRIVPKNVKGGLLEVFEHPFFCKIDKNEGGPFGDIKKIAKKVS